MSSATVDALVLVFSACAGGGSLIRCLQNRRLWKWHQQNSISSSGARHSPPRAGYSFGAAVDANERVASKAVSKSSPTEPLRGGVPSSPAPGGNVVPNEAPKERRGGRLRSAKGSGRGKIPASGTG